jgi:hypothetical protein
MRRPSAVLVILTCISVPSLGMAAQQGIARHDRVKIIGACWERDLIAPASAPGGAARSLKGSHLICFKRKGRSAGVSFDMAELEGWDWEFPYRFVGRDIVVHDRSLGRLQAVEPKRMILVKDGEAIEYRYVCRTKAEDIQCERLQ